ncbi:LYR motif-containing protein 4 isoform X1 [Tympanuchus pallidicinctus]|uniref:LYR motif-containing protein 4 isoform X1 n=1 Tax=Tympanuchus pallidicinctus TaxID=109042 RepID=UPI002286D6A7|nr:LYR motif-containing protein 4 isoform X1 [Tympanuchus pallidicinctus]
MAASSRAQVLRLYRALLRESQRFSGYNYRTYAIRRIRDAFRENKSIKDSAKIEELVNKAKENLEIIHRQNHGIVGVGRITESQNCRGWKGPPEIESNSPAKAGSLHQVAQVTIGQMYATQKLVIESPGNT